VLFYCFSSYFILLVAELNYLYSIVSCDWLSLTGGEAVLGPALSSRAGSGEVSSEMAVDRQKSQEGSGVLCVKVVTDGPTRVLQITDITQQVCDITATVCQ